MMESHGVKQRGPSWNRVLWIAWLAVASFFFFGGASRIGWGDQPVSFLTAWQALSAAQFRESLFEAEFAWVVYGALIVCVVYGRMPSIGSQMVTLAVGALFPVFLLGSGMETLGLIAMAPISVVSVLGGFADGESYVEGMPQHGAIGLWMLMCSGLLICQAYRLVRRYAEVQEELAGS